MQGPVETHVAIDFLCAPVKARVPLRVVESQRMKQDPNQTGFSLVELIIVVGIILTLSALSIPSFM